MANKDELRTKLRESIARTEKKRNIKRFFIKLGVSFVFYLVIGFALGFGLWTGLHLAARLL